MRSEIVTRIVEHKLDPPDLETVRTAAAAQSREIESPLSPPGGIEQVGVRAEDIEAGIGGAR